MPAIDPTRRALLTGAGGVLGGLLAGCSGGPPGRGSSPAPSLHFVLESLGDSIVDHYVVDLDGTQVPWDEAAFEAALDGSTDGKRLRRPFPVRNGEEPAYAEHDGTYYELDSVIVGQERVRRPVLRLFQVDDRQDGAPDAVARAALPAVDRRAVQIAHLAARARGNEGGYPVGLVERGGFVYRSDERARASRLLRASGPSHVRVRDAVYRVEATRETFYEPVYRPDVNPVAGSIAEMEAVLRGVFVDVRIDPEELGSAEREIIRNARAGGYQESYPFSDPFVSVLTALDRREYIDGNVERDARAGSRGDVLLYGEEYHDLVLRFDD